MNNQSLYEPLYSKKINEENDAVIALGEENMICVGHFYKKKNSFYVSYPLYGKDDIMNLIQATNLYAELTKRYLEQKNKNVSHTDFETMLQDSCYFFCKKSIINDKKRELSTLTRALVDENELHNLFTDTFPKQNVFVEVYNKFKKSQ